MNLTYLRINNHPILNNINLNLINPKTKEPYKIIAFVGENGCGKTTILNEIFNYNTSNYIVDKEQSYDIVPKPFEALYLRQGSLQKHSLKEITKLINGEDIYPTNSSETIQEKMNNLYSLGRNCALNHEDTQYSILDSLNDEKITSMFKNKKITSIQCGAETSTLITGKNYAYNLNEYSSGEQEILVKLKDLKSIKAGTDCVLLDEPESSLHPRWQLIIISLIEKLVQRMNKVPQILLATHSEKILESIISRDDVLIVRLFKENNKIKYETTNDMNLKLETKSFSELDYVIFHIPTMDYNNELLLKIQDFLYLSNLKELDQKLESSKLYKTKSLQKVWNYKNIKGKNVTYNTLPVYIRNYLHHHKKYDIAPTLEEIEKSIVFLRKFITKGKIK